jgi:methyl-accepting chemotaxis protein
MRSVEVAHIGSLMSGVLYKHDHPASILLPLPPLHLHGRTRSHPLQARETLNRSLFRPFPDAGRKPEKKQKVTTMTDTLPENNDRVSPEILQLRETTEKQADAIARYESILDAVPFPIHVTDNDMRWIYMNRAFEKLLIENREITDRKTAYGKPCSTANANICRTENCGINQLRTTGKNETYFDWHGASCRQTTAEVRDANGKVTGYVETVEDLTSMVRTRDFMAQEIDGLIRVLDMIGEGDLTAHHEITQPNEHTKSVYDEMVRLRDAIRKVVTSLKTNIGDVNREMQTLTSTADQASRSVEDASKGVTIIAKDTTEVSENAQKAASGIDQIAKAMQDMSAAIEEITSSMESVTSQAKNANDAARKGAELAGRVNTDMDDITKRAGATYEVIREIEKQMADISKIIVLIRDLANQTNLLALNAAIEAARAGEHGRGFAVVASEVKSLAQESRSSAEKIEDMITHLNTATRKAAEVIEETKSVIERGGQESRQALEGFVTIQKAAETVANSASEVAAATEEQAATTEEITASIHEVSDLVGQTAKDAGDAAAATEESAAALDEISQMIRTVHSVAVGAAEANSRFRVN